MPQHIDTAGPVLEDVAGTEVPLTNGNAALAVHAPSDMNVAPYVLASPAVPPASGGEEPTESQLVQAQMTAAIQRARETRAATTARLVAAQSAPMAASASASASAGTPPLAPNPAHAPATTWSATITQDPPTKLAPTVVPPVGSGEARLDGQPQTTPPVGTGAGSGARTRLPDRDGVVVAPRRALRSATLDDRFNLFGALAAGLALACLLFGWFTPMTGAVGWVVIAFLGFLALYALLVALRSDRQQVSDKVMTVLLSSAGILLFAALVFVVVYTVVRGSSALPHLNFFTQTMALAGPLDPLNTGGILHAIVGTLIQISIALAITIPLGVITAVFLNEIGGRFARFVRTVADAMTALPSIVAGLFVYAAIIALITHERSGFAAALAITVMMLPIVIRASDVVLRLVAGNLREASYALGATRWRMVWHVVLPTARSGLVTAVILGTARGIGETSPVLLTSGVSAEMNLNPFSGPMISLPLQVFDFVKSPEPNMIARGFGTAAVLIAIVLALFTIARLVGGRGPTQLSKRQRAAAAANSARDIRRIEESPRSEPAMQKRRQQPGAAGAAPGATPGSTIQSPAQALAHRSPAPGRTFLGRPEAVLTAAPPTAGPPTSAPAPTMPPATTPPVTPASGADAHDSTTDSKGTQS
ncbi:phosphate ABC transporter permease subunit PstA [Glaciihabitans tibetensis]|uniref:Phosphate transport system permease protein PstA n=1 Tax=Glaciihabitans tibetensis TaxID=1266600 RepID=A0A2T0VBB4_9MICO|nr:phosphate ABC transporter permease PstA [Glaciihabitans tibetensis]PRY67489.1 phosphate ABC transporter permease subunit PstA [Glaciihabitans tibetensis]